MSHQAAKPLTAAAIAEQLGGSVEGDGSVAITGMQGLGDAKAGDLSFVGGEAFVAAWGESKASATLAPRELAIDPGDGRAVIRVQNVDLAVAAVLQILAPPQPLPPVGVHGSAIVEPDASLGAGVRIGPGCYVGHRVTLSDGAMLAANVTVFDDCSIGRGTVVWSGTVIRERCTIGAACIIHPNATIGSDGFGYRPAPDGKGLVKVPQIGTVQIGDAVEIGAGTCIDRGKFGPTTIGDGTKIDNLCHIAHNCRIGRCVIITACAGIAGSVTIGDGVQFGGVVAVRDHVTIGAGAKIAGRSAIVTDVPAGASFAGMPAKDAKMAFREAASLAQLPELIKRVRALEKERSEIRGQKAE